MGNKLTCLNCIQFQNLYKKQSTSTIIQVQDNNIHINGILDFQKQSTFKKLQIAASQLSISSGIGLLYNPIIMRLLAYKQSNIFKAFSNLKTKQNRIQFINKIGQINLDEMDSLYQNLVIKEERNKYLKKLFKNQDYIKQCKGFQIDNMKLQDKYDIQNKGYQLLHDKKVAIVFMCAGPSSRFYFQDKFLHKLQPLGQTQLLAILFNKLRLNLQVKNNRQKINQTIIMIGNEQNIQKIQFYMKQNNFFYFSRQHIYFTEIPSQPILDQKGKICLNFQYNYIRRPKGSACYIETILSTEAFQILKQQKIQYLHFVGTQNIAESPGDPLFLGLTDILKRQISIKCTDPILPYENFDRIFALNKNRKLLVLDRQSLNLILQKNDQNLWSSPIAMNSMIFSLNSLQQMYKDYQKKLQLAKLYRYQIINENYYDFGLGRPIIGKQCYSFSKDIKDLIYCSKAALVVKVNRSEFIPIISVKDEYAVKQGCQKYQALHINI